MKGSQNAEITPKQFTKSNDNLLFRHKMTKLPSYGSAPDLANRFVPFFKVKIDNMRDELPDCSDIDLNMHKDKPYSTSVSLKPRHRRRYGRSYVNLI